MMTKKDYSHFNHGWMQVVQYANAGVAFHKVGAESSRGSSLTASIPTFDGLNYQIWSKMMTAYLKTQGLWYYVNGMMVQLVTPTRPTTLTAAEPTGDPPLISTVAATACTTALATFNTAQDAYNASITTVCSHDQEDDKVLGFLGLKISLTMQYLVGASAKGTWDNIKDHFDTPSAAGIFVGFKALALRWMGRKIHLYRFPSFRQSLSI